MPFNAKVAHTGKASKRHKTMMQSHGRPCEQVVHSWENTCKLFPGGWPIVSGWSGSLAHSQAHLYTMQMSLLPQQMAWPTADGSTLQVAILG